jgi:hypothetical protein
MARKPPTKVWKLTLWIGLAAGLLFAIADILTGATKLTKAWMELKDAAVSAFGHEVVSSIDSSSAYTSVGCGTGSSASARFTIPAKAYDVQTSCQWVNTDKLKTQSCSAARDGTSLVATGSITGLDKDWLGNCPGGGHGVLALKVIYKMKVL